MDTDNLVESLVDLVNNFEFSKFMPEISTILGWIELFTRLCVIAAPIALLFFGLWYLILPPKEANHIAGYRFYFGMGSVEAWRFTQKLAGICWTVLGLVLTIVMVLISNGFRDMDAMDMVYKAVSCILWQIGLIAASCIIINLVLIVRFDAKGNLRFSKKKRI